MDLGIIVGLIGGVALTVIGILWGGGNMRAFVNAPSVMITLGGALASLFVGYGWDPIFVEGHGAHWASVRDYVDRHRPLWSQALTP